MGAPMVDDGQLYSFFKEYRADIKAVRKTPTSFGNNPKSTLIEETSGMRQDPPASVREEASSPYEIDDDKVEPGTIIQEIQTGFMFGERLLRPSFVGISKKKGEKGDKKK